jgi:hypothetical protein
MTVKAVARFAGSSVFLHSILGLTPQALCFRPLARAGRLILIAFEYAWVDGLVEGKLLEVDGPLQCLCSIWQLHG